ncbi:MAG: DnaJ domain-containing protein [Bacteroidetes bacterium]|nr:molecular chaperone DnaJ [Bacteroidota bacterium]MCB0802581.1 TerB family tellurite resistance protein [Flavobacteriales bacterium]NOG57052.1 DnaJ domain-containing protein [Bacteroidota bacterium]
MKGWGKWIGALIGFSVFNFFGGVLGFIIGSMFDARTSVEWDERFTGSTNYTGKQAYQRSSTGDFAASLLVLTAAVMKADGKVVKSELEYVKKFYIGQFGAEKTRIQMQALRDLLNEPIDVRSIGHSIRYQMQYHSRLQLLHYLFGIAQADGSISTTEVNEIRRISGYLGINSPDFDSIKAMFIRETGGDFKILEISTDANNDEIKSAYRKMAKKYHPDKVASLGDDVRKQAEEKFRMVQEAYENLKKARGFS